jgi:phosphate transport system substrate-binding protein
MRTRRPPLRAHPVHFPAAGVGLLLGLFSLSACARPPADAVAASGAGAASGPNAADADAGAAIENKGSDTIVNLALAWAEAYRSVRPQVAIAVTGGGTGTGIAALMNRTVDIANASRRMKEDEVAAARAKGFEPVEHTIAIDALAIIVNRENPVSELTIGQLSDIFTGRIANWRDVGGRDAPIVLVSREINSGTHVYFLEEVVRQGDKKSKDIFAPQTLLMPSSVGITSEVRRNPNAIGYDGLGYVTAEEKVIAVAGAPGAPYVKPSVATAADGTYPLSRALYMYTVGAPAGEIAAYLDWIVGPAGQTIVEKLGFVPLGATGGGR